MYITIKILSAFLWKIILFRRVELLPYIYVGVPVYIHVRVCSATSSRYIMLYLNAKVF